MTFDSSVRLFDSLIRAKLNLRKPGCTKTPFYFMWSSRKKVFTCIDKTNNTSLIIAYFSGPVVIVSALIVLPVICLVLGPFALTVYVYVWACIVYSIYTVSVSLGFCSIAQTKVRR